MTQRMTNELIEQAARGQVRERRQMDIQPERGLGLFEASNRRIVEASMKYELVYSTGGHGGPYHSEAKAKAAAERLLKGGKDRWIAVIDAKYTSNLAKADAIWMLKRDGGWKKGPLPLPNIIPGARFKEGLAEGVYDRAVTNPEHKPKKLAARLKKELTKGIGKGTKIEVVKAEATMPRGWDYGFHGILKITLPGGDSLKAAVTLHSAKEEASGNAHLDAKYGGVVSNPRGRDLDKVLSTMIGDVSRHLKKKTEELGEDTKGPAHNFGGKMAPPFTSTDNDGKPGLDPEHRKGGKKKSKKATEALDNLRELLAEAMPDGTAKSFREVMLANLTQWDMKQRDSNIYRLGHFLKALEKAERGIDLSKDDPETLNKFKKALTREFEDFPPRRKTLKAIDKFLKDGKPPKYSVASKPRKKKGKYPIKAASMAAEETELAEAVSANFKKGGFWSQEFRGGVQAWFYPQAKLANGGVKGLLLNTDSRKPVNSSVTKMDMRLWTDDDPDNEVKAIFKKHPKFEEIERVDPVEALVESVMAERKQTADYSRGGPGRSSEMSYKDTKGGKAFGKKVAARGERQSKKKHIDAQLRGEGLDALRAKLGLGGKVVESTSPAPTPTPAPPKPLADNAPPPSTMRRESASFASLQEVG